MQKLIIFQALKFDQGKELQDIVDRSTAAFNAMKEKDTSEGQEDVNSHLLLPLFFSIVDQFVAVAEFYDLFVHVLKHQHQSQASERGLVTTAIHELPTLKSERGEIWAKIQTIVSLFGFFVKFPHAPFPVL